MRKIFTCAILGLCAAAIFAQAPPRTFVSTAGVDTNPCSRTLPCRNFPAAISAVAQGGEVVALDSGGFGGDFFIFDSITLVAPAGVHAAIAPTTGNGISPNTAADAKVILRGLYLSGRGALSGIRGTVGTLYIEDCVIERFSSHAVLIHGGNVYVSNTSIRANGGNGFWAHPGPPARVHAVFDRCRIEGNSSFGIYLREDSVGSIRETVIAGNSAGIVVHAFSATAVAEAAIDRSAVFANGNGISSDVTNQGAQSIVSITRTLIAEHTNDGILSYGTVRVGDSTITRNGMGLHKITAGTIYSFGDNRLTGNTVDGTFTGPLPRM